MRSSLAVCLFQTKDCRGELLEKDSFEKRRNRDVGVAASNVDISKSSVDYQHSKVREHLILLYCS